MNKFKQMLNIVADGADFEVAIVATSEKCNDYYEQIIKGELYSCLEAAADISVAIINAIEAENRQSVLSAFFEWIQIKVNESEE